MSGASLALDAVRSGVGDRDKLDASSKETIQKILDSPWFIGREFNEPG
jgi:hypothetical protein